MGLVTQVHRLVRNQRDLHSVHIDAD
jgi:hypothetical protein